MNPVHQRLEALFLEQGLVFLGACAPECALDHARYQAWLAQKKHAGLSYLERNSELRRDPSGLLEGTQSVVVFALPYFHRSDAKVALYSQFRDYHKLLRKKGATIFQKFLTESGNGESIFRVTVDSAPVLERALALKTGSGFIGKNTCFIHPEKGSFLLLGEIFSTVSIPESTPTTIPNCGTCTLCQTACPTGALDEDYILDANRCLSYWTIEHRGEIPEEFHPHLKEGLFGCDICQTICPYNDFARNNALPTWIRPIQIPSIEKISSMTEDEYRKTFSGTPLMRAKHQQLTRNASIALQQK